MSKQVMSSTSIAVGFPGALFSTNPTYELKFPAISFLQDLYSPLKEPPHLALVPQLQNSQEEAYAVIACKWSKN